MTRFPCPYLKDRVEWTEGRERHIAERHPDLLPQHRERVVETVADPDQVRRSIRLPAARLFSRWYPEVRGCKHIVVVVVSGPPQRHWVIAAYIARRLAEGEVKWKRS